jgi:hypothetical protein
MTLRGRFSAQPNQSQGLRKSAPAAFQRRLRGIYYLLPAPTLGLLIWLSRKLAAKGSLLETFRQDSFVRQRIAFSSRFLREATGRRRLKLIGAVDTWWEILNKKRRIFASLRLLRLCV